jgi:hypothetical protein
MLIIRSALVRLISQRGTQRRRIRVKPAVADSQTLTPVAALLIGVEVAGPSRREAREGFSRRVQPVIVNMTR